MAFPFNFFIISIRTMMKPKRCAFHPNESLVNFCRSPQCLLPMCPACVKIHSSEHVRLNTHGFYDCISDMEKEVQDTLESTLKSIILSSSDLKQIFKNRQFEKSSLAIRLKEARGKVIETINKYIDGLQHELMEQLSSVQSISCEEFSQIDGRIQKISTEAQVELENLNGQKSMKTIINHISSNMPAHYHYHLNQINSKINEMRASQMGLQKQFKVNSINDVLKIIGDAYQLSFGEPIKRRSMRKINLRDSNVSKLSKDCSTQGSHKKVL